MGGSRTPPTATGDARRVTRPRLPERLTLAAHHDVLDRGARSRQVGAGPDRARVLDDLPAGVVAMLDRLGRGACPVRELLALGGPPAAGLLTALLADGLLTDPDAAARAARTRASSVVLVRGDGPLAVAVSLGLARARIGRVHAQATGTAGPDDVAAGLPRTAAGRRRGPALAAALAAEHPDPDAPPAGPMPPDLLLLVGPAVLAPAPGEIIEHLPVTLRDGRGVVGPLVLPGRSPCLRCVHLTRTDRDPGWPLVAARLAGRDATADPHVVAGTAALAVAQALAALEGPARGDPAPASLGTALEIDPRTATITGRPWPAHPACRCGAPGTAGPAEAPWTGTPCTRPGVGWTIGG